uniref:Uncharacterized protein n=1 Tax=Kalanchoe fedtschenkoi TaxID=63787 RepID=A0A7N0U9I2_KALFE
MISLQRSSVSFRRQGSSGRIWADRVPGLDLPTTPPNTGHSTYVDQDNDLHQPEQQQACRDSDLEAKTSKGCGLSFIFKLCVARRSTP